MIELEPRGINTETGGILSGPASDGQFPVKAVMEATTASHSNPESPYALRAKPTSDQDRPHPGLGCVGVWNGNREAAFKGELPGLATPGSIQHPLSPLEAGTSTICQSATRVGFLELP